jgi:hypothetical protein
MENADQGKRLRQAASEILEMTRQVGMTVTITATIIRKDGTRQKLGTLKRKQS